MMEKGKPPAAPGTQTGTGGCWLDNQKRQVPHAQGQAGPALQQSLGLRPSHPWPHLPGLRRGPGPPTALRPDVWVANR